MAEDHQPESDFLKLVATDEITLAGTVLGAANLRRLIALTQDQDRSNRDWATMLLSQQPIDTAEVRAALLVAAEDNDPVVRAEAIFGLARRDGQLALPYALRALAGDDVYIATFEAAALIADPKLVDVLRPWADGAEDDFWARLARDALAACEGEAI